MNNVPKYLKVKEGHKPALGEILRSAAAMKAGLGFNGVAKLMADLRIDQAIFGYKIKGNARIRRKKYAKFLKQSLLQSIAEHVEPIQ